LSADDELRAQLDDLLGAGTDTESVLAAFEQAPSLLAVCEGPELIITALNDAARQVYGDRVGVPVATALAGPSVREIAAWTEETFRSGQPTHGRLWHLEPAAGDELGEDAWLSFSMVPSHAVDGSVRGVICQAVEVSEQVRVRARAESRAQELQRRLEIARDNLVSLHDALLPEGLPLAPGVDLAARYLLAEDGGRAGGDWFDAIALPDGRLVLVVGDVVGNGVRATVVMGELRTLFEERVRPDGDLVAALELLEGRAARIPQARAATLCVAVLEPLTGRFVYCTAGHPPPLVVSAAGDATYLPLTGAGGLGSGLPFALGEHRLAVGDTVLLYSDGLVERPGRTPVQNTLDLSRVAADAVHAPGTGSDRPVQRLARITVEELTRAGYDDDITVLAARRVAPPAPLEMTVPAFPDTLRAVRQNLGDWLAGLGVGQIDELALQHAVGELVSNSVEHAYEPESSRHEATVTVIACLRDGGVIEIEVSDRGRWRRPGPAGGRGRGLAMASGFSDELRVTHGAHGTRAVMRQRPSTPVDLLKGTASAPAVPSAPMEMRQEGEVVEISGALDHRSSDELRRRLSHATRGGTIGIVVDLGGVTHLGSAGVQVLYDEMLPHASDDAAGLTLVAPPGSPAQHVLELVRLPYVIEHDDPRPA